MSMRFGGRSGRTFLSKDGDTETGSSTSGTQGEGGSRCNNERAWGTCEWEDTGNEVNFFVNVFV